MPYARPEDYAVRKGSRGGLDDPKPQETWDQVEALYREGVLSNRTIAAQCDVTEGSVRHHAKRGGWVKGEPHAIRALAVRKANDRGVPRFIPPTPERLEALSNTGADILVRHRTNIGVMAGLVSKLVGQLQEQTDDERDMGEGLEDYFMLKAANDPLQAGVYRQRLNAALHAIGLHARSKTMLNLVNAAGRLIELERKAWNMDEDSDRRCYEDLLAEVVASQKLQAASLKPSTYSNAGEARER